MYGMLSWSGYMRVWHAQDVKHHPASVDLELIKRLLETTRCKTLQQFLAKEFSSISKDYAGGHALSTTSVLLLATHAKSSSLHSVNTIPMDSGLSLSYRPRM